MGFQRRIVYPTIFLLGVFIGLAVMPSSAVAAFKRPANIPLNEVHMSSDGRLFSVTAGGLVYYSTNLGESWGSQQLPAPVREYSTPDGTVTASLAFQATSAAWDDANQRLWVYSLNRTLSGRRGAYGGYEDWNLQVYRATWNGSGFDIATNTLQQYDMSTNGRYGDRLYEIQMNLAGDTPVATFRRVYRDLWYSNYWEYAMAVGADPSTLARRTTVTLRSVGSTGWFNGIVNATTTEGGQDYVYTWTVDYDERYNQTYAYQRRYRVSNGYLYSAGSDRLSYLETSGSNLRFSRTFSYGDTYWMVYSRFSTSSILSSGSRSLSYPNNAGSNVRIAADATGTYVLWVSGSMLYRAQRQAGGGLGTPVPLVADLGTAYYPADPQYILAQDQHDGQRYLYHPRIQIPTQLNPSSGTHKNPVPIFTWGSAYSQQAFQLDLLQGNTVVHTSGRVETSDQFYRIPRRVMEPSRTYRAHVRVWDSSDRVSLYSPSSIYTFDPSSVYAPFPPDPLYPTEGTTVPGGRLPVSWQAAQDPDSPHTAMRYDLEYRPEGGAWTRLVNRLPYETFYDWDLDGLNEGTYELRVRANDYDHDSNWAYFPSFEIRSLQEPAVSVSVPGAGSWQPSGDVSFGMDYQGGDGDVLAETVLQVSSDAAFTDIVASRTFTGTSVAVPVEEGTYFARARSRNTRGQHTPWSAPVPFGVDGSAPALVLSRDSPYQTNSPLATLSLQATDAMSGIADLQLTLDTSSPGPWLPYAVSQNYLLPPADGNYTIYVRVRDRAGNRSPWRSVPVQRDTQPPVITDFRIDGGAERAAGLSVILNIEAADALSGIARMSVRNDGEGWGDPVPFSGSANWVLREGDDGLRTVYMRVFDQAGNFTEASAGIQYMADRTPPQVSVVVNDGDPVTTEPTVSVTVEATDDATPASRLEMRHALGGEEWPAWGPYQPAFNAILPGEGLHRIRVQVRDLSNNVGTGSGAVYFASDGVPLPRADEPEVIFNVVLQDGSTENPVRVELFGQTRWLVRSSVLAVENWNNRYEFSRGEDAAFMAVESTVDTGAAPGPFSVWLRYRFDDALYSKPVQYSFLYDPEPPAVALSWQDGVTVTRNGYATLQMEAEDNVAPSEMLRYQYSTDGGTTWTDMASPVEQIYVGRNGKKSVLVRVTDPAGNSTTKSLSIWAL